MEREVRRDAVIIDLPRFPHECLPDNLRDLVAAVAANRQVAPDMVAVPLLAILAACVQRKFVVEMDADYQEPLSLYTITVARPSERKSAVISFLQEPLWDFQQMYNAAHERAININSEKPMTLYVDDATPEKIAKLMKENNGSLALISDEPDALRVAAGLRYGKSGNVGLLLQAWSAGKVLIQRVTEDRRIEIDRATMSIAIMSQPRFLEEIMGDKDLSQRGFTQRFLYSQPKTLIGQRSFRKPEIPQKLKEEYRALVFQLLKISTDSGPLRKIHLDEMAQEKAGIYFDALEPRLVEELQPLEGWAGKIFGQMLRIAGIMHCAIWQEEADQHMIDHLTIADATAISDYFIQHAKASFTAIATANETADTRYVWERILDSGKDTLSKSEIRAISKLRGKMLDTVLAYLVEYEFLHRDDITPEGGGRPKELYTVLHRLR